MYFLLGGSGEALAPCRRASTNFSNGINYPNNHLVDQDILTRIRALLSRNGQHPPATPHTSEEHPNRPGKTTVPPFGFSTTESAAKLARRVNNKIEPILGRHLSKTVNMTEYRQHLVNPCDVPPQRLRASSSFENFGASVDDIPGRRIGVKRHTSEIDEKSWIVQPTSPCLACLKASNTLNSDGDKVLPINLDQTKKRNPDCHSLNMQSDGSAGLDIWPGRELKAEPGDLTCFLPEFRPRNFHSKKQHRTPSIVDRGRGFSYGDGGGVATTCHTRRATSQPGGVPSKRLPSSRSSVTSSDKFPPVIQSIEPAKNGTSSRLFSTVVATNFSLPSPRTSSHTLPDPTANSISWRHDGVSQSQDNDGQSTGSPKIPLDHHQQNQQNSMAQNDGPLAHVEAIKGINPKTSDGSIQTKQQRSPSLLSGASRNSGYRHYLLKPSVTESQPVDTGLPTGPILSPVMGFSEILMPTSRTILTTNVSPDHRGGHDCPDIIAIIQPVPESLEPSPAGALESITSLEHILTVPQISAMEAKFRLPKDKPEAPVIPSLDQKGVQRLEHIKTHPFDATGSLHLSQTNDGGNSTLNNPSDGPKISASSNSEPDLALQSPTERSFTSSYAAYWGFVPTVKGVVHEAFNVAVRNVVSEAVLPQGMQKDKVARAYRQAVADSLMEVAEDADDFLRRPPLRKTPDPSHRLTCLDDPTIQDCIKFSCLPEPTSKTLTPIHTWRGNDCKFCPHPSDQMLSEPTLPIPSFDIPILKDVETWSPKDPTKASIIKPQDKDMEKSREVLNASTIIPDRASSRNGVSTSRRSRTRGNNWTNSSSCVVYLSPSQKRSYNRLNRGSLRGRRSSASEISTRESALEELGQVAHSLLSRCEKSDADSLSFLPSDESYGERTPVNWLRGLLTNNSTYESRLTALPPRTRYAENSSKILAKARDSRPTLITQLLPGKHPKIVPSRDLDQEPFGETNQNKQLVTPSGLSKTINELEGLLNEALLVARKAADRMGSDTYNKLSGAQQTKGMLAKSRPSIQSDELSLMGSVHESVRSGFSSSHSSQDGNDEGNQLEVDDTIRSTGITIAQALSLGAHSSGWPPTGRVSTPYPPNTQPSSLNSSPIEVLQGERLNTPSSQSRSTTSPEGINQRLKRDFRAVTRKGVSKVNNDEPPIKFQDLEPFQPGQLSRVPARSSSMARGPMDCQNPLGQRHDRKPSCGKYFISPVIGQSVTTSPVPLPKISRRSTIPVCRRGHFEDDYATLKQRLTQISIPSKLEVRSYIIEFGQPQIQPREGLMIYKELAEQAQIQDQLENQTFSRTSMTDNDAAMVAIRPLELRHMSIPYSHSLDGTQATLSEEIDFYHGHGHHKSAMRHGEIGHTETTIIREREKELRDVPNPNLPITISSRQRHHVFSLKNKRHVSLRDHKGFSLTRSHKRQSIARDWSPGRKRFCAAVACISTALVGILVGIYAGETPAIQYWIVDFHHYTVLGNVFFFIALSIPTFLFWPLPLLHGRKPYILGAMSLAMPLLFPQALTVGEFRSPYTHTWRITLILPRALMGFCLGFANMNFKGILTDLFGASLQSTNPHQEHVDEFDVRRHGGGMGVWLGLWTWSAIGSIGIGFLIGAVIINSLNPAWGFYISVIIIAFVLLLNILTPEVRRSAFRRSVTEVKDGGEVSRRLARGEVKMHLVQTGPKWWGEEFHYGLKLSVKMLRQPGFMVMAAYVAWMYGQIVLIVLLLGSLCSNSYRFKSHQVGAAVAAVPLGAFIAIPFQKASFFSRDRSHAPLSDDDTYKKKVKWSSHLVRRAIFVLTLPFAGLGYTLSSGGPHIPFIVPILFAALIGFLSNIAMAECHGIIMETFDTSDLQPGMTGRSRGSAGDKRASKRTNYSSFPRVSSAFGITQGLGYLIAALASGVGGALTRNLGQQAATGVMAFILLVLSILLLGVLIRFKDVQIIPDSKKDDMGRYHQARNSTAPGGFTIPQDELWRPIIIGNPHHSTRRMCILELGSMSRFSEIRRKNRLIDEQSLEALHPNHQMMMDVKMKIKEKESQVVHHVRGSLSRHSSRGSRRSLFNDESRPRIPEQDGLEGHVKIETLKKGKVIKTMHSSRGSMQRRAAGIVE